MIVRNKVVLHFLVVRSGANLSATLPRVGHRAPPDYFRARLVVLAVAVPVDHDFRTPGCRFAVLHYRVDQL